MTKLQQELEQITACFFDETLALGELHEVCAKYASFLNQLIPQNLDNEHNRNDIQFSNGKALGTYWASLCIQDFIRTTQFIRGINEAIKTTLEQTKQIHILYAGTGPYATLILPFLIKYAKQSITYTLLEINAESIAVLQQIMSLLELDTENIEIVHENATTFSLPPSTDIIISETMQKALAKEQQVPIYLNLMKQAKPNCLFIPDEISIDLAVRNTDVPLEQVSKKDFKSIATVFKLNRKTITETITDEFPEVTTRVTNNQLQGFNTLTLNTYINVFKNYHIGINDSGLTVPLTIDVIKKETTAITIKTQYVIDQEPKLNYTIYQS